MKEKREYLPYSPDSQFTADEIIVLWSGGCDSTLLLYYVAKRMQEMDIDPKTHLFTISIYCDYISINKQKYEKQARDNLINVFKEKFNIEFESIEMKLTSNIRNTKNFYKETGGSDDKAIFPFQLLISTYALILAHPNAKIFDGFLLSDGFIYGQMFGNEFANLLKSLNNIAGKELEYIQPLIYYKKSDIIKKLFVSDLYQYIWFCEEDKNNTGKPCVVNVVVA